MQDNRMYKEAMEIIGELTPLRGHDCGKLCDCACCKGGEEDGMRLFPGEQTELEVKEADGGRLAVCTGTCDREKRPLACRIFPYYASIDKQTERIRFRIDPRSVNVCPVATKKHGTRHSVYFRRNARQTLWGAGYYHACRLC